MPLTTLKVFHNAIFNRKLLVVDPFFSKIKHILIYQFSWQEVADILGKENKNEYRFLSFRKHLQSWKVYLSSNKNHGIRKNLSSWKSSWLLCNRKRKMIKWFFSIWNNFLICFCFLILTLKMPSLFRYKKRDSFALRIQRIKIQRYPWYIFFAEYHF